MTSFNDVEKGDCKQINIHCYLLYRVITGMPLWLMERVQIGQKKQLAVYRLGLN